jgi:hypothetical protein
VIFGQPEPGDQKSRLPAVVLLGLAYLMVLTVSIAWLPQHGPIGEVSRYLDALIGGFFILNLLRWGKAEVVDRPRTRAQEVLFVRRWTEGAFWLILVAGLILLGIGHWIGLVFFPVAVLIGLMSFKLRS